MEMAWLVEGLSGHSDRDEYNRIKSSKEYIVPLYKDAADLTD